MAPTAMFYDFTVLDNQKRPLPLSLLKGKVVVVVNVATLCGFAPQYYELQQIWNLHRDKGLVILAFPCNQFGNQEPLPAAQVAAQVHAEYGVTFPIMEKVYVNGPHEHPVYTFLKNQQINCLGFKGIKWNFEKFVIDRNGEVVRRFGTDTPPRAIEPYLRELLEN